jgi:hypothetical protein
LPHDFANSFFGAYFFIDGRFDLGVFDPITFNKRIFSEGFRNIFVSYNPNPPSASILFAPFALLPLHESKLIFNCVSAILFCLSLYRISKHFELNTAVVFLAVPIIFFIPIRNQILFGQTYFLLFFLLSEGYLAYQKGNYPLSALLWALAIFLKIFPAAVILLLLTNKNWKACLWLGCLCFLLLVISVLIQGTEVWTYYAFEILPRNLKGEITSAYATNYQSANVFLKYLFVENVDLNPVPVLNSKLAFHIAEIAFKSFIIGCCILFLLQRKDVLAFGMLILGSILISSYGSTYSNILLLFILLPLLKEWKREKWFVIAVLILLAANLPISIFKEFNPLLQFPRLAILLSIFVIVVAMTKIKFRWQPFIIFSVIFSLFTFTHKSSYDPSRLLTKEERKNIPYGYGLKNGYIYYNYWNENGDNTYVTSVKGTTLTNDELQLINGQIFYKGNQITNSNDKKLKPMLLNSDAIVYLSDKDNGIGFYNLRILKIIHEPGAN